MTDLVERLRERSARSQGGMDRLDTEAADEIERLRKALLWIADMESNDPLELSMHADAALKETTGNRDE